MQKGVCADAYSTSLLYPFQREAWRLLGLGRCRLLRFASEAEASMQQRQRELA